MTRYRRDLVAVYDTARRLRKGDRLVSLHGISGARITDEPFVFEEDILVHEDVTYRNPANVQFNTEDGGCWILPAAMCVRIDTTDREET